MRLLHIDTLTFKYFPKSPPPYIVTSHRWYEEEVTHYDVLNKTNQDAAGYEKIRRFCKYVRETINPLRQGRCPELEWIWIDTCCINRMDFSDVSRSVNSMFRWYRNAQICIAFLQDIPSSNNTPGDMFSSLEQSVWFKRCWTLPELLAPKTVVLLNAAWEPIGHRPGAKPNSSFSVEAIGHSITGWLSSITGIGENVLTNFDAHSSLLSREEKLKWMEGRETTEEEDFAYCQLGIFGVFLPLIYGEGKKNALERLFFEIDAKAERSASFGDRTARPKASLPLANAQVDCTLCASHDRFAVDLQHKYMLVHEARDKKGVIILVDGTTTFSDLYQEFGRDYNVRRLMDECAGYEYRDRDLVLDTDVSLSRVIYLYERQGVNAGSE